VISKFIVEQAATQNFRTLSR